MRTAARVRERIMDRIEEKPVRHGELRLLDMEGSCRPRELRRHLVAHRSTHARLAHAERIGQGDIAGGDHATDDDATGGKVPAV